MAQFQNIYPIDLNIKKKGAQELLQPIGEGDANGVRVGAQVFADGAPVTLNGQCVAKVIRADGSTVPLTGTISGNIASVALDQQSCAVEGPIQVAVIWVSGTNVTTLVIAYGTIVNTISGTIIQPSTPIPDLTQLLAEIDAMQQATAAANAAATGALANFAGAFVQATDYPAGTYVTYTDGNLYALPNGHEANATWANTTKTQVSVGGELSALKSALNDTNDEVFEIDNISIPITYTGKYVSSTGTWNTSQSSSASDYFAVTPNQRMVLSGVLLTSKKCIVAFHADKTFASKIAGGTNDTTVSFVVPEDCYYIAVTAPLDATSVEGKILSSNIKENADNIQKLEAVSFNRTIQFFMTDILRELAWTITNGDGLIKSFEQITGNKSIVVGEPYDFALISGEYVTKAGVIEGYASWSRTNVIPCDSVDSLVFTGNGTIFTTAGYSVFYDKDMKFISNFTVTLTNDKTSATIPVPQNANTFVISGYTKQFANLVSIVPTRGE